MEMYLAMIEHHQRRAASAYMLGTIYRKNYDAAKAPNARAYNLKHYNRVMREARKSATLARQMVMELLNK